MNGKKKRLQTSAPDKDDISYQSECDVIWLSGK